MKRILKSILLLTCLSTSVLFVNCEKEEITEEPIAQNVSSLKLSIKQINSSVFKNNMALMNKIAATPNTSYREVYKEIYNLTVNTDSVKYIESSDNSVYSYTFEVINTSDPSIIQNLVFTLQADETYLSELVQYSFLENDMVEIKKASLEDVNVSNYLQRENDELEWESTSTIT